jgi:hypothetical protein
MSGSKNNMARTTFIYESKQTHTWISIKKKEKKKDKANKSYFNENWNG